MWVIICYSDLEVIEQHVIQRKYLSVSKLNSTLSISLFNIPAPHPQVAAKLARQQKVWDMKMDRERERMKEAHATKMLAASAHRSTPLQGSGGIGGTDMGDGGNYYNKTAMEIRREAYAAKREAKERDRKER